MIDTDIQTLDPVAQIHVIPMGYEYDRIVDPPTKYHADKVIHPQNREDEVVPDFHERAIKTLREEVRTVGIEQCNIFQMFDALRQIGECITEHADDNVYANLATGSKVTAIGGMIACMTVGGTPFYVSRRGLWRPRGRTIAGGPCAECGLQMLCAL